MRTKSKSEFDLHKDLKIINNEPKHVALTRLMENQIRKMKHGERLPVVRDLMRRFKISQGTLDHALHELETRSLITRRQNSGIYVNRQNTRQVIRRTIGVVVADITDPFCALLVKGIERTLAAQDYMAILCNGQEQFQDELKTIHVMHGNIDGAIINPKTYNVHNPEYIRFFSDLAQSGEFPFLLVDIMIPGVNAHFIGFDNFNAFYEMARVLVNSETHIQQVIYLGVMESVIGAERINGLRTGLKDSHISDEFLKIVNIRLPVSDIPLAPGDLRRKRPIALVSGSPLILPRLLTFCGTHNLRIPEDVVIAGVLEENFSDYIHAPVLGWIKPSVKLGELSVHLIQSIIAGKPVKQITRIALERFASKALEHLF